MYEYCPGFETCTHTEILTQERIHTLLGASKCFCTLLLLWILSLPISLHVSCVIIYYYLLGSMCVCECIVCF